MLEEAEKIKNFTDLDAWKEGHRLVLMVYETTRSFPREELFGLVSQMRRCAVSITSNIAEGFSRRSARDKAHFCTMAMGSLTELQNQLLIGRDLLFIPTEVFDGVSMQAIRVQKLINGLIRHLASRDT